MSTPAPGWYPDPTDSAGKRWWDGTQWTQRTQIDLSAAPPPSSAASEAEAAQSDPVAAPAESTAGVPRPQETGVTSRRRRLTWVAVSAGVVVAATVGAFAMMDRTPDVPDVVGQSVEDARASLEALGFVVEFRGESVPDDDDGDHWTVSSQDPEAGDAGEATEVRLWVSTPVTAAVKACDVPTSVGDNGSSVVLDVEGEDYGSGDLDYVQALCVLTELEMPDSVWSKMEDTRALDGRQTADWDDVEVTWSYHPDDGLDVIVELTD